MAENNSSALLLPCPFCGERTQINALGRSWWRMESGHRQDCLLSEVDHTVPQTDEQKQLLIDAWNTRAPQAVEAQAAQAAVSVPDEREAFEKWASGEGINIRTDGGCYRAVIAGACYEAWQTRAALAATPALPATEDSSAGDLAEVQAEPVANCYSDDDGDTWRDCPDDSDFVEGRQLGEEFELQASIRSWSETFRVSKVPDETSDDYEVEPVSVRTAPRAQPADALDADTPYQRGYRHGYNQRDAEVQGALL